MNETGLMAWTGPGVALALLVPLICALMWVRASWRGLAVRLAPWVPLPALAVALLVPAGTVVASDWVLLGVRLGMDEPARALLLVTALLWSAGGWFGRTYLATDVARDRFFGFYLAAMTGNIGLILALDAPLFYTCFALMSFASYGLVIHTGTAEARRAGRIYLYLVVAGEVLLFAGMVLIVATTGSTELPVPPEAALSPLAMALIVLGFGIKAGLLPLHVWLPLAHPVAPTPASAVLSGAMIKAGVIGWLRFVPAGGASLEGVGTALVTAGLAAAFYGVAVGLTQRNPKAVLAYSSISQMGFLTLGVGAALLAPSSAAAIHTAVLFYAVHHGLAKASLFLGVGVAGATGTSGRRWVVAGLILPALALAGAPWTSGALAKATLKSAIGATAAPWPAVFDLLLPLAATGTTLLLARFLVLVWPKPSAQGQLTVGLVAPWAMLVALAATTFVWWPGAGAVSLLVSPVYVLTAAGPVVAGALAAGIVWSRPSRMLARITIPAGDLLALVERAGVWRRRLAVRSAAPSIGDLQLAEPQQLAPLFERLTAVAWPERLEPVLRRWPVAGALFVVVATTFVWLLRR